jgi:hypothetical protein
MTDTEGKWALNRKIRRRVRNNIARHFPNTNNKDAGWVLSVLAGIPEPLCHTDYTYFQDLHDSGDAKALKALELMSGPHCYAIYRAIILQKEEA